jgi:hypothetical protein
MLLLSSLFILEGVPLPAAEPAAPRLTVLVVVDQMRADFLDRFRPYFGEAGFRRLLEGGASYTDCHYRHGYTKTAPGHATILSGVNANVHGIIGNEWLDRTTFVQDSAVADPAAPLVGLPPRPGRYPNAALAAKAGRSPRNFLGTTVGDRLKARYGAAAKVFGIADKDRAAILTAGPKADGAYWNEEGIFVTSTYYRRELPDWLKDFNASHNAAQFFGRVWERLLDPSVYDRVQGPDDQPGEQPEEGLPTTFPKRIDGGLAAPGPAFYNAFDRTPWSNDLVEQLAERLVTEEHLGEDDVPDLLAVGFSQTDRIGHACGPDSHEVMDSYVRLDLTLARLLAFLDARVGPGRWLLVLTADHGIAPLPERVQAEKGPAAAGRIAPALLDQAVRRALDAAFGPLPGPLYWVVRDGSGYHLNPAALKAKNLPAERLAAEVRAALLREPLIAAAYTRAQLGAAAPLDAMGEALRLSFHSQRSPDVVFVQQRGFVLRPLGTDHGTPYDYDTHVPLLWYGAGVRPGVLHPGTVHVEDIAPTLAGLLGLELPPAAQGRRLF